MPMQVMSEHLTPDIAPFQKKHSHLHIDGYATCTSVPTNDIRLVNKLNHPRLFLAEVSVSSTPEKIAKAEPFVCKV